MTPVQTIEKSSCVSVSKTPERRAYYNAKKRCTDSNHMSYKNYGARGIRFLFESFDEFLNEVGPRPGPEYSLDRIDNDGDYTIGNVKWSTAEEQARYQRKQRRRKLVYRSNRYAEWEQTGEDTLEVTCSRL